MTNIKSIISNKIFFLILIIFTPLLYTNHLGEAFEFPKMFFVYFAGITIFWIFLIKKIKKEEEIKIPNTAVLGFISGYLISTVLSSHIYTSIWGYYTRFNGGLVSVLVFSAIYIYLINTFEKTKLKEILDIICLTLIPISLYAILQHAQGIKRVYSTLGQPNWLGAYIVFLIPSIFNNFFVKKDKRTFVWFVIYILSFTSLWFTYSLSSIIAFVISTMLFAFLNKDKIKKQKIKAIVLTFSTLLIMIIKPGLLAPKIKDVFNDLNNFYATSQLDINKNTPQKNGAFKNKKENIYEENNHKKSKLENLGFTKNVVSDPSFIRLNLWKATIGLIKNSPKNLLVGTGPETFPYAFQKFRPKKLNYSSEWNLVFNKPHNYYLELISNIGIAGFTFYMIIISKFFKTKKNKNIIIPSIAGFLITNLFGWPTVSTTLLFWVFLAQIPLPNKKINIFSENKTKKEGEKIKKTKKVGLITFVTVLYLFCTSSFYKKLSADFNYTKSRKQSLDKNINLASVLIKKSIKNNPKEPRYYYENAKITLAKSFTLRNLENKIKLKKYSLNNLQKAEDLNPNNLISLKNMIPIYYFLAIEKDTNIDKYFIQDTVNFYKKVKNKYPKDAGVQILLAKYTKKLNQQKLYKDITENIKTLRPDLIEWAL